MIASSQTPLADSGARLKAVADHQSTFMVEAGAGSGKTSIMAGRIALMLADGIQPRNIAAVTFTELAASELLGRVRELVHQLAEGYVPKELRAALPEGPLDEHLLALAAANAQIDEIACSTIHGFCQQLIKPYPVEANIDPGANVMDPQLADLAFADVTDRWIRETLNQDSGDLLSQMVLRDIGGTLSLLRELLDHLRRREVTVAEPLNSPDLLAGEFQGKVAAFSKFIDGTGVEEPETALVVRRFQELAAALPLPLDKDHPANLVGLLASKPHTDLCTSAGAFRAYRKKGKWTDAAKQAGFSKADGERHNVGAERHNQECCQAWTTLGQSVADQLLADMVKALRPVVQRFQEYKRNAAVLDFDDLIFAARDLLRDHETVRRALAARFAHVLVDEFQDTDPLQSEIFWRLCGEPGTAGTSEDWTTFQIRPGALFLVGDPKQAIYRFRGADVAAYVQAREALLALDPESVLSIFTNFRSCAPILEYVNDRFASPLSTQKGQPGFTALDPFHPKRDGGVCVAALEVAVADGQGKASTEQQRDAEAEAVAELCAELLRSERIHDRRTNERRPCRPGDIALLAPTGTDLWRYEEALERRAIPVATLAGKGFFRRQEVQDLIALTRVLADPRDTLALGALLRGPLIGLTEEELLDIVWDLPRSSESPDDLSRFTINTDVQAITHTYAREVMEKLQTLRRSVHSTTPHALLSESVAVLGVRPVLLARHQGEAERALANLDLYLSLSRAYAVRGFRAFAEAMTTAWEEGSREMEGRPDAQEEAVALYTVHGAKGLEWPIVVPVNTMTQVTAPNKVIIDRSGRLFSPILGVCPTGYAEALEEEKAELERERIRLWYVAATRACELLVLPRLDVQPKSSVWISLVNLSLEELPALAIGPSSAESFRDRDAAVANGQTRDLFASEAASIAAHRKPIVWKAPSREEGPTVPEGQDADVTSLTGDGVIAEHGTLRVQGGRARGVVLHKLIEEVLSGETAEAAPELRIRAECLIGMMGESPADSPEEGLSPREIADCVIRALTLPEVAVLRPRLMPEFPVYGSEATTAGEEVYAGIVDAVAVSAEGTPEVVVDWKSDVAPTQQTLEEYRGQVRSYLQLTGAEYALLVLATPGQVIPVRLR